MMLPDNKKKLKKQSKTRTGRRKKMATTTSTVAALAVVSSVLMVVVSVPVPSHQSRYQDLYTCRDRDQYSTKQWRTCSNDGEIVSYTDLDIPNKLLRNEIESFQVPENSFKCYRVQRYTHDSLLSPSCPAVCRLTDLKTISQCPVSSLVLHENQDVLVARSPRHGCSDYYKNEVCVYNISMTCQNDSHLVISETTSQLDLGREDFLDIIFDHTHRYRLAGNQLTQQELYGTRFLMIFWSEKDRSRGPGFRLQFECPVLEDDFITEGSGEEQ